jgi:sugar (pentulose or hexulose) kinase
VRLTGEPGRYLGIDVGTSVAKLALFTAGGDLVATASRNVPLGHPAPGHVEQDPEAVLAALRGTVAELGPAALSTVELVAVTGQGDGCWLLDGAGQPVRPAVSWMDGRGAAVLGDWERAGIAEAAFRINGNALFPGAQAPILNWLDEHEPGALDAAATAAYCKDMVFQRLTGIRATDASDASVPFGDHAGGYSAELLDLVGLAHRAGLLAPVVAPLPAGRLTAAGCRTLGCPDPAQSAGLAEGVEVVGGPFDLPACAAGGGVRDVGDGMMIVGTTLACQVLVDRVDTGGEPAGMHLATGEPGRWLRAMAAMVGTASLDWTLSVLGLDHTGIDGLLAGSAPGAGGVTVLPHLAPSGERAPFVDPLARGQFSGLSLTTTRADLVRALCEGLAYAARSCLDAAGLTGRLVVCGGGTRSLPWLEIFASVLARPLELARSPEVGARGAVVSALRVTGRDADLAAWTAPERVIDPDPAAARHYEDGYHRFLDHQRHARALWHA